MSPNHRTADDMVLDALHSMRTLVGMEVAFISQMVDASFATSIRLVAISRSELAVRIHWRQLLPARCRWSSAGVDPGRHAAC